MSDPAQGGVFIYHPLHKNTPMYALYAGATGSGAAAPETHALSADDRARLHKRYRLHMRDVLEKKGLQPDAVFGREMREDRRALVTRFRAFFPALLGKTTLTGKAAEVGVFFPAIDCFDSRCLEIAGHGEAVFITSRTLDVIELFANTLSMCARLNGLELRRLIGFQDPPPPYITFLWFSMEAKASEALLLDELISPRSGAIGRRALREQFYLKGGSDLVPRDFLRASGHAKLSLGLTWLMMRAVNDLVRGGRDGERYLGVTSPPARVRAWLSLDANYLATLILAFIVLHEISHLALSHNRAEGSPVDPLTRALIERLTEFAAKDGGQLNIHAGQAVGHETGADGFALAVIEEKDYRDPMLEAATLWCAALAGSNEDRGDWARNVFANPMGYPGYAMRVWYLNGKFSTGERQGAIAQQITRQAEELASALGRDTHSSADRAELFLALWKLALCETTLLGILFPSLVGRIWPWDRRAAPAAA